MVRLRVDSSEWKQVQVGRITGPTQPGEALKILVFNAFAYAEQKEIVTVLRSSTSPENKGRSSRSGAGVSPLWQ